MITGYVPTGRKPNSWMGNVTTQSEYNALVSTGMAWVLFSDLPLSWKECEEILKEKEKENE